jgi:hypothetical protein
VRLYGRHLAYAAAFGLAEHAVAALPVGEEDDHLAWSAAGGRWRRVRVRYPRVRPPAWGRHPAVATLLGIVVVGAPTYLLSRLDPPGGSRALAAIAIAVLGVPILWGVAVLWRAIPDLFATTVVTGVALRCRTRSRGTSSGNQPKCWYYVAVDDGTRARIAAYRVPRAVYERVVQGTTVTATVTPRLGYVRALT